MKWADNACFYLLMVVHLLGLDMVGQCFFNIQLELSIFSNYRGLNFGHWEWRILVVVEYLQDKTKPMGYVELHFHKTSGLQNDLILL